ncbi:terpenoid synthase [Athelia psychrophila]|uniref:Terpene synthase n=1 Tax=Athelia psychrophila TaxID=1759441 RepID=A0A166VV35_9AGAM|nr:terpenoid synthase [Fibularhizoctonia sp. CBS 109695]
MSTATHSLKTPQTYYLPYTLRNWSWERIISPYYVATQAESVAWLESFRPFSPKAQAAFNNVDCSLLAALIFSKSSYYNLRSGCDLMATFFILDDYTDLCNGPDSKALCDATMDAIMNPDKPRPQGESIIGEITRQFWKRASLNAPKACQERFVKAWRTYVDSVVLQAERRSSSYICTVEDYMDDRRDNVGAKPALALLEISLELDLPHSVMEHPAIISLNNDITDMTTLANDMYSYKKEVLGGDADYNAVTVVMYNQKTDLAGALQWISNTHDELVDRFLSTRQDVLDKRGVPSWGKDTDRQVAAYVDGLGQWIRGHDEWNFESGRYFGSDGLKIQKSRRVVIAKSLHKL